MLNKIIAQTKAFSLQVDHFVRTAIINFLANIIGALQNSDQIVMKLWGMPAEAATNRIAVDLGIFAALAQNPSPMTVPQLSKKTSADPVFLARILRALASHGTIKETNIDEFTANRITKILAVKGHEAALAFNFDVCGPVFQAMPEYLKKNGYPDLNDAYNTVWQDAYGVKGNCFEWLLARPKLFTQFNLSLAARRENQRTWLDVYPLKSDLETTKLSAEQPLFVDVGGNIGHRCADFKARYPDLPGQVILEDLEFVVNTSLPTAGVTPQAHDFTTPQPIKGSKFYYLSAVLHDWPNAKCRVILKHIVDAMSPESIVLVDDIVAPNKGVSWPTTQYDIAMMAIVASRERTEAQWSELFDSVGLKILRRMVYTPHVNETITALVKK